MLYRKTYVEVNLDNLSNNVGNIINYYKNYDYYFGVVKGNCYGHGTKYVINELIASGVNYLAVSSLDEALDVRKINKDIPILSLEPIDLEYIDICVDNNITITVHDYEYGKNLLNKKINKLLKVHLKVDSGMNRLGFKDRDEFSKMYKDLKKGKNILVEGIFSHFATLGINDKEWDNQLDKFRMITSLINLSDIPIRHLYKSAAFINHPKVDFCNGIRLGIAMYGYYSPLKYSMKGIKNKLRYLKREFYKRKNNVSPTNIDLPIELKPAFKMYSQIIQIKNLKKGEFVGYGALYRAKKEEKIGIMAVGYDDGLLRSNKGRYVSINNKKYRLIGDIGMGMSAVLIDNSIKNGDMVTLIGDSVSIKYVANYNHTSIYEVMCSIDKYVSRVYVKKDKIIAIDEGK